MPKNVFEFEACDTYLKFAYTLKENLVEFSAVHKWRSVLYVFIFGLFENEIFKEVSLQILNLSTEFSTILNGSS